METEAVGRWSGGIIQLGQLGPRERKKEKKGIETHTRAFFLSPFFCAVCKIDIYTCIYIFFLRYKPLFQMIVACG